MEPVMRIAIPCILALAACQPVPPAPPIAPPSANRTPPSAALGEPSVVTTTSVRSLEEIEGRWDIVSFEGYEPARLQGATPAAFVRFVSDGKGSVGLRIECNYSGAEGDIANGRWTMRPSDNIQTAMGCGPEREARDARLFAFFDLNPTVMLQSDGRLVVRADDRELILERPEVRRLAYRIPAAELLGDWRLEDVHFVHEEGGYSGIGVSNLPGVIRFEGDRALYTACPALAVSTYYRDDGILQNTNPTAPEPGPSDCPALTSDTEHGDLPRAFDIMRALYRSPFLEAAGDDRMVMQAGEIAVTLVRAD